MNISNHLTAGLVMAALAMLTTPHPALAAPEVEKPGSRYLQCDGLPNNMTTGESAARLLGALTLLAVFAPDPESVDISKRKFGAEGVAVCTSLIEGETKEGDPDRRIGLILGRAVHRIEAKDLDAALADVAMARGEAVAAGLMADPYYARSRGRSFDQLDAAILFRQGKAAEAQAAMLRGTDALKHSPLEFLQLRYSFALPKASDTELQYLDWGSRAGINFGGYWADRLDELGRFAEAARLRDALTDYNKATTPDKRASLWIALAAISHALAGDKAVAAERAAEARANFDARKAQGKPEDSAVQFIEAMDLYGILAAMDAGDVKSARRLFAARSEWVASSFGVVLEVNRRLRAGAAPDELIGGLAKGPEALWAQRADARRAELLAKDSDNKTLFWKIDSAISASAYEALSKTVWRTEKSTMVLKPKQLLKNESKAEVMALFNTEWPVALEAYMMHAALLARSRGHQGFVIAPIFQENSVAAGFLTGNRGAPGLPDALFNDANTVIADMSPLFPDSATLKARRAVKPKS